MIYLMRRGKTKYLWLPAIPLIFYSFITSSYILSAPIGLSLDMTIAFIIGGVLTAAIFAASVYRGRKKEI